MAQPNSIPSAIPALTLIVSLILQNLHPALHPSFTILAIALIARKPSLLLLTIIPLTFQPPLANTNWTHSLLNQNLPTTINLQINSTPRDNSQRLTFFQASPPGASQSIRIFCPQADPPLRFGQTRPFIIHRAQIDPQGETVLVATTKTYKNPAASLRTTLSNSLNSLPPQQSALLASIVLGQRQHLPKRTLRAFLATGCLHLLAVSGLHLGLIAALAELTLRLTLLRPTTRSVLVALTATTYALIVGLQPSVLRALIMVYALLLCRTLGRKNATWNALALASTFSLSLWPDWLFSPGFQLSYFAVVGMLLAFAALPPSTQSLRDRITINLRISAAAFIATAPLSLVHFGEAAPIGLLMSIIAAPIFTASLCLGAIGLTLGLISQSLAYPFLYLAGLAAQGLVSTLEAIAHIAPLWRFPDNSPLTSPLLAIGILCIILAAATRRARLAWFIAVLVSASLAFASLNPNVLRLTTPQQMDALHAELTLRFTKKEIELSTNSTTGFWPRRDGAWIHGHALGLSLSNPKPGMTALSAGEISIVLIDPRTWSPETLHGTSALVLLASPSSEQRQALSRASPIRLEISSSKQFRKSPWGPRASAWILRISKDHDLTLEIDDP